MKHRDIFRVPARVEHRTRIARAWKDASTGEARSETESLGWFIVATLGDKEFAFAHGKDKIVLAIPMINLIIEYETPQPSEV